MLAGQNRLAEESQEGVSKVQLEEAGLLQKASFIQENLIRIEGEMKKLQEDLDTAEQEKQESKQEHKAETAQEQAPDQGQGRGRKR